MRKDLCRQTRTACQNQANLLRAAIDLSRMTHGISVTVRTSPPPPPLDHIMFPVFLSSTLKLQWQSRGSCMGFQV